MIISSANDIIKPLDDTCRLFYCIILMTADKKGVPFAISTVSVCPLREVMLTLNRSLWFYLYVLRDRKFMKNVLQRAKAAGYAMLVCTADRTPQGQGSAKPTQA